MSNPSKPVETRQIGLVKSNKVRGPTRRIRARGFLTNLSGTLCGENLCGLIPIQVTVHIRRTPRLKPLPSVHTCPGGFRGGGSQRSASGAVMGPNSTHAAPLYSPSHPPAATTQSALRRIARRGFSRARSCSDAHIAHTWHALRDENVSTAARSAPLQQILSLQLERRGREAETICGLLSRLFSAMNTRSSPTQSGKRIWDPKLRA